LPNARFGDTEATNSKFDFKLDKPDFSSCLGKKRSPQDAAYLASDLAKPTPGLSPSNLLQVVYDLRSHDLQIAERPGFHRHTPSKGGLDPLLATNAK
jgi:hypothetical protein